MAERKHFAVGDVIEVPAGVTVTRPEGSKKTVTGTVYVLDAPGTFLLGEREVVAK